MVADRGRPTACAGAGKRAATGYARQMSSVLGTVVGLHRYPVKSMRGESPTRAWIDAAGLDGDRAWALLDPQRQWASAKTNRERWRLFDGMLDLRAETVGGSAASEADPGVSGTVVISLPDGRRLVAGTPEADRVLSERLGEPLRLDHGDRGLRWGRHHDGAPLHLVTSATLAALADAEGAPLDPLRLRPNLVVATPPGSPDFAEDGWLGRLVRVGGALLRVSELTERCVMTTRAQGDELAADPTVLKRIGRANQVRAGVYLTTESPGLVTVGDQLTLVEDEARTGLAVGGGERATG